MKVVHNLASHGLIQSTRGKGGGIQLARPPGMTSLGDVVWVSEPNFDLVECFNPVQDRCAITRHCGLKGPLHEAQRAFMAVLDRTTLARAVQATAWQPLQFVSAATAVRPEPAETV